MRYKSKNYIIGEEGNKFFVKNTEDKYLRIHQIDEIKTVVIGRAKE